VTEADKTFQNDNRRNNGGRNFSRRQGGGGGGGRGAVLKLQNPMKLQRVVEQIPQTEEERQHDLERAQQGEERANARGGGAGVRRAASIGDDGATTTSESRDFDQTFDGRYASSG